MGARQHERQRRELQRLDGIARGGEARVATDYAVSRRPRRRFRRVHLRGRLDATADRGRHLHRCHRQALGRNRGPLENTDEGARPAASTQGGQRCGRSNRSIASRSRGRRFRKEITQRNVMSRFIWTRTFAAAVLVLAGGNLSLAQDHGGQYSPADIQYGATIYTDQCARCHGATGDQIGGVNLRSGQFRKASTDDELRVIVVTGIAGTAMPAFKFDPSELTGVIAYLRNMRDFDMKSVAIGDAARGQALFESKGACATCHRVNGKGSRKAPNLSDVGSLRPAGALQQSLVDPTGAMLPLNRSI